MKTVSVAEARRTFKVLVDEVSSGHPVSVIRRGREVARLVPPKRRGRRLPALGPFRASIRVTGEPGRRPRAPRSALLMYIDTSLLVPYYCPEALSRAAERTLRDDPQPAVSDLVEVEFRTGLYARPSSNR